MEAYLLMKRKWQKLHRIYLEVNDHDVTIMDDGSAYHLWNCWCRIRRHK